MILIQLNRDLILSFMQKCTIIQMLINLALNVDILNVKFDKTLWFLYDFEISAINI